jgi:tetratricopeptide (TPR) repeat protein
MSDMDPIKDELQAFNPAHPDFRRKLWVRVVTPDRVYWHFFWLRLAAAAAVLALAGWLALTGAAWAFLKYKRGYADASYLDLAFYPWRSAQFRSGLAHHYLARGHEAIAQRNYRDGYAYLMAGLNRVPDDLAARQTVAAMQVRYGFVHRALKTLEDGLPFQPDLAYLKQFFGLLLESREDDRVVAIARRLLPPAPDRGLTHQFIALEMATAHFERGRYDEAEQVITEWGLENSVEGQIVLARCDWERGSPERAVQRLEAQVARFPKRDDLYLTLVRFHRELGDLAAARRYAVLRFINDRTGPGPRIDLMQCYHATDDRAAETKEMETYLRDFASVPPALNLLGWFALDTHQPALLERVHTLARDQSFPLDVLNFARLQLALAEGSYRAALDLADAALHETNENREDLPAQLDALRALALIGSGNVEAARPLLHTFLAQSRLRPGDALFVARQLRRLGAADEARQVLDRACTLDPLNQATLAELVRVDTDADNRAGLVENLPKLLRSRKPSRAVLEEALLKLDQPGHASLRAEVRAALARASATPSPG